MSSAMPASQEANQDEREGVEQPCPMKGKILPELVINGMGWLFLEARALLRESQYDFLLHSGEQVVHTDFHSGLSYLQGLLEVKMDFLRRLPWSLCGLAYTDHNKAREHGCKLLRDFDLLDEHQQRLHHRRAQVLLSPSSAVRQQLHMFVQGAPLESLPHLEFEVGMLRFLNVTERYVEGSHSLVKRQVKPNSAPTSVSLTRRLFQIKLRLHRNPGYLWELAKHFDRVRELWKLPEVRLLMGICGSEASN